jgi:NtrC-family two-component system response regulator AlgB
MTRKAMNEKLEGGWSALVIDDDPGVRQSLRLCLEAEDGRVVVTATAQGAIDAFQRNRFDVVFLDLWLQADSGLTLLPELLRRQPGMGIIVITAFASFESAVEAMKLGAVDYLPKPFTPHQVRSAVKRVVTTRLLKQEINELHDRLGMAEGMITFDTKSPLFSSFLENAARAAGSDAVVLLTGESGTGKTVLARWIRQHSPRCQGPFVTIHCPMLSTDLMSSVLFGHKRGAFTGAVTDSVGKVQEAEGGTLFLDEVGDLSADAQARLLRFLNDRTYERLGEALERQSNVRLIAATNRRLEEEVRMGRMRQDLSFRLHVISLAVPPLRDRKEDIMPLAQHFLQHFSNRQGRNHLVFSDSAERQILDYDWPGNLRQLSNAIERAVILSPASVIEGADLGLDFFGQDQTTASAIRLGSLVSLDAIEREHIAQVVARCTSFESAAKTLGIDVTTLQRKRKKYGLN